MITLLGVYDRAHAQKIFRTPELSGLIMPRRDVAAALAYGRAEEYSHSHFTFETMTGR